MPHKDKEVKKKYMEDWAKKNKSKLKGYHDSYYKKSKKKFLAKQKDRVTQRRAMIAKIALKYGCQNVGCRWQGPFESCQLDFHHLDPKTKKKEVGSMASSSIESIIAEINKCVVLCRNCHASCHWGESLQLNEALLCHEDVNEYGSSFSV